MHLNKILKNGYIMKTTKLFLKLQLISIPGARFINAYPLHTAISLSANYDRLKK